MNIGETPGKKWAVGRKGQRDIGITVFKNYAAGGEPIDIRSNIAVIIV